MKTHAFAIALMTSTLTLTSLSPADALPDSDPTAPSSATTSRRSPSAFIRDALQNFESCIEEALTVEGTYLDFGPLGVYRAPLSNLKQYRSSKP